MCFSEDQITIEINDGLVSDEKILTENFNEHCIKIDEKYLRDSEKLLDETMVEKTIDTCRNHLSIKAIKASVTQNSKFNLPPASTQDINEIISLLNSDKTTGSDGISVILVSN